MKSVVRAIDNFTDVSTKVVGWFVVIVMLIICYEVFMRYFFHAPTKWVHEITQYIFGVAALYCGTYCVKEKKHITVDLVYAMFPVRVRAAIDGVTLLIIIFWGVIFLYYGGIFAYESILDHERSFSALEVLLWPVKISIPICGLLLILQTACLWFKAMHMLFKGEPFDTAGI